MSRYDKIIKLIELFEPRVIVETGTWNGNNAIRMLQATHRYHEDPVYYGYDLFEDGTAELDKEEFNIKPHNRMDVVYEHILKNAPFAKVNLTKGNTRDTLKHIVADFVFIDGGHSLDTIRHDYNMVNRSGVIVFDDYYTPDEQGQMPDISKVGCNAIVQSLPHTVIHCNDPVKTGGIVNLAVVFGL
jgi:predicted O-methyltransferase YrrM